MSESTSEQLSVIDKLNKDIKAAAKTLQDREARYLVDLYYQFQDNRIRAAGQIRSMDQDVVAKEPHQILDWVFEQSEKLEGSIRSVLGLYAKNRVVGAWSQSIVGIGPVISAGLIANISMETWQCMAPQEERIKRKPADRCREQNSCSAACHKRPTNTVGQIWRFAGLDPTVKWEKGKVRPWNASLKRLCWLIGQSFVKVSNNKNDFYGAYYKLRKEKEQASNEAGLFAAQAEEILTRKKIDKKTEAYKAYSIGKLPPAHIQQRAERYAVKLFLSHWHKVAFVEKYNTLPPAPYVITKMGHSDVIDAPNWPFPIKQ